MNFLSKLFSRTGTSVYEGRVQRINELETEYEKYSDDELKAETKRLRLLPEEYIERGFALVREAAKRVLNQRHFDVQLIGGLALYDGMVAEMATGEGKTLAATAPVFARALTVPPTG